MRTRRTPILASLALLFMLALLGVIGPEHAAAIETGVYYVPGNPSCATLNADSFFDNITSDFGFKINDVPQQDDIYYLTNAYGELTGGAPADATNYVTFPYVMNPYFDWAASLGIDAVIVKGGPNADAYVYVPEAYEGGPLSPPVNPDNEQPYGISHVEFCYDYELTVEKTASAEYTRTYTWEITKAYDATYDKFIGDPATSHGYAVDVDQTVTDSAWAVTGTIIVTNDTPFDTTFGVTDFVDGVAATVDCPTYDLTPADQVVCTYAASLSGAVDGTNTATVTSSHEFVDGATATADYAFGDPTTIVGFPEINVSDTNGLAWTAAGDDGWTYTKDFVCPPDPSLYVNGEYSFTHTNRATITETGQWDDATVTVNCYAPVPGKDANTAYTRDYTWEISKGDDGEYWKFIGDPPTSHDYTVAVNQTITESAFAVAGTISVYNPHPTAAMNVTLIDSVGGVAATLDCGGTLTIPAGGTATCDYSADLLDKTDGTNSATVTLNGIDFGATADYAFGEPTTVIGYPTIHVSDTNGEAWTATGDDSWTYTAAFTCSTNQADYTNGFYSFDVPNTATITETDQSDGATVTVNCYAPVPAKDANTAYTREYTWTIAKDKDGVYDKFIGDVATTHPYTVTVDQTVDEYGFVVTGTITVQNPNPMADMDVTLDDSVGGMPVTLSCGGALTVPAGGSATCDYAATLKVKADGTNTVTVTLNGYDFVATEGYAFGEPTTVVGYPTIHVSDTNGESWTASGDATWTYDQDFACSTYLGAYTNGFYSFTVPNTATIEETGQWDDAAVTVNCYAPLLSKDAVAEYDEIHTWDIDKSVDPTDQSGYPGDELGWTWMVTVTEDFVDDNFAVFGPITITNPVGAPGPITVVLSDVLDDGTAAVVDCGDGATSVTLEPGFTHVCSHVAAPLTKDATLNTVTGIFNGVTFTATAPVDFVANVIDGTAIVTDEQIGLDETLTAGAGPWTWTGSDSHTCSSFWGDYGPDGTYSGTVDNTATVVGSNGQTASADASTTYLCEAARVEVLKLTDGLVNATKDWSFALYVGPDGFGGTQVGSTSSTLGDADGYLDFGMPALRLDTTYTICELGVPAGWSSVWQIDTDNDGIVDTIVPPYNPNGDDPDPEDLGHRCFDFGAGTSYPLTVGYTLAFEVDNFYPGGDPRTPGYWKNWNTCTGGGQQYTAAANGGFEEGYWLLDDILNDPGIIWGDFTIATCEIGVDILDKREIGDPALVADGDKLANLPAFNLATSLLAAQLNFAAGAETCQAALDYAAEAEALLVSVNFDGTPGPEKKGAYFDRKKDADAYQRALELATLLDEYNNGYLCNP